MVGPAIEESVIATAGAPPTGWDMYGLSEKVLCWHTIYIRFSQNYQPICVIRQVHGLRL